MGEQPPLVVQLEVAVLLKTRRQADLSSALLHASC